MRAARQQPETSAKPLHHKAIRPSRRQQREVGGDRRDPEHARPTLTCGFTGRVVEHGQDMFQRARVRTENMHRAGPRREPV
jgi:hypothetical protein